THRADPLDYPDCAIIWYSVENREDGIYDLGRNCFGSVQWIENVDEYYYMTYSPDGSGRVSLFRLDMATGEQAEVSSSEDFLALETVSPDGRYAVVLLKEENYSFRPVRELDPFYYPQFRMSTLYAVVDTIAGQIIYEGANLQYPVR